MNPRHAILLALFAFLASAWGCGDDSGPTGPGSGNDPVPTAAGVPDGTPTTATIGAAGGELASSDGLFTVSIPAGALAADTEIGVQPLTNTAWGGRGKAYRLTPDGLAFAAPVGVVFELTDELLAGSAAAYADVAVQRDDGVWGVLKNRTLDTGAGTLTGTTSHFSDYSMIEGLQLLPASAVVDVNGHVALSVQYCIREAIPGDPDLVSLLISCDAELAPLGSFENWSVNGAVGGNGTIGTVGPTSGVQATYTAPAVAPVPNVVAVSVETTFEGNSALLVSNIRITSEEQWVGASTVYMGSDYARATVTWVQTGAFGTIKFFKPTGFIEYTMGASDCALVSLTPDTWVIIGTEGVLLVDYATDPPTFSGGAGSFWDAEHCYLCPDGSPTECVMITLAADWFGAKGEVHDSGTRIDAIILDDNDDPLMVFNFVKQTPPAPAAGR